MTCKNSRDPKHHDGYNDSVSKAMKLLVARLKKLDPEHELVAEYEMDPIDFEDRADFLKDVALAVMELEEEGSA